MIRQLLSRHSPQHKLFDAARNGNVRRLTALLGSGVSPNLRDKAGRTAIFVAAKYGHEEVVRELLARGADVSVKDRKGRTALFSAVNLGSEAIVRMLMDAGCDPSAVDYGGYTVADMAARKFQPHLLSLFAEKGDLATGGSVPVANGVGEGDSHLGS